MNITPEIIIQGSKDAAAEIIATSNDEATLRTAIFLLDLINKSDTMFIDQNDRGYFCPRCRKQQKSPDPKRPHLKFYCTRCGQRLTHKEN